MARNRVLTTRDIHAVRDPAAHRAKHAEFIAKLNAAIVGRDPKAPPVPPELLVQHHVSDPLVPYVNLNRWVADCECGSGVGVHPEWGFALCFACGAEHPIEIPDEWREIEAALIARKYDKNRNWRGETVTELLAENERNGA